jgi:predicted lipid-binding transport protein (Tim44 family)
MSELEEKLENILGNPQAMAQIMSLAQSLNLGGSGQPAGGTDAPPPQPQEQPPDGAPAPAPSAAPPPPPASAGAAEGGLGSLGGLLGGLSSLDPKMLSAAAGLIGQFNSGGDDQRVALLNALRPFVKEQRYARLDKAIQIAKLSRLIRSGLELFRAQKESAREEEGGHV